MSRPIFTQEMADAGELPPIGARAIFSRIDNAPFDKRLADGDVVEVVAHYCPLNDGRKVAIFAFEHDWGRAVEQAVSECFKPIDTRTEKQKAVDEMISIAIDSDDVAAKSIIYEACLKLYQAGYIKLTP